MDTRRRHIQRANAAERRIKCFEYRKQGLSYIAIGKLVGISTAQAHADVTERLREFRTAEAEVVEEVRALEVARLDMLWEKLHDRVDKGDVQAVSAALRVMERRASLLGLDAPKRIEATGKDGAPLIPVEAMDAILRDAG